jgi:hypothetical protein
VRTDDSSGANAGSSNAAGRLRASALIGLYSARRESWHFHFGDVRIASIGGIVMG